MVGATLQFLIFQKAWYLGHNRTAIREIHSEFKVPEDKYGDKMVYPNFNIFAKNYFTTPGGDWAASPDGNPDIPPEWLPQLINYGPSDGPVKKFTVWAGDHPDRITDGGDLLFLLEAIEGVTEMPCRDKFRGWCPF
jgi:hypothetical protein